MRSRSAQSRYFVPDTLASPAMLHRAGGSGPSSETVDVGLLLIPRSPYTEDKENRTQRRFTFDNTEILRRRDDSIITINTLPSRSNSFMHRKMTDPNAFKHRRESQFHAGVEDSIFSVELFSSLSHIHPSPDQRSSNPSNRPRPWKCVQMRSSEGKGFVDSLQPSGRAKRAPKPSRLQLDASRLTLSDTSGPLIQERHPHFTLDPGMDVDSSSATE
eukprot:maker-scaffold420_size176246-snap-gene-0.23 protein:Tk05637 transcript:maker-scaffold420_size176246-snap-gene-0.23-mRNA-1 annotation:"peptidoglycan transglycosylase"